MTTARDIMHVGATCVGEHETLVAAARLMRDRGVGALPICGDDDLLHGIVTDRDIVVKCLADGRDPSIVQTAELAQGGVYHVQVATRIADLLNMMTEHQVRRLAIIDNHRLVGIVSEADIARHLPEYRVAQFVRAVCAPPD